MDNRLISKELNLKYEIIKTPASLKFEDGVTYNTSEINKLSDIKSRTKDYKKILSAIHMLKLRLGIVIVNVA